MKPDPAEQAQIRRLKRMRRIPLLLLGLMAVTFFATVSLSTAWAPWVNAFAEAAMVGALADWFAVVALFRHPMGIPIPHTAIIPRRKDEIGDSLAKFLERHFLSVEVLKPRLASYDLVGLGAKWLSDPANAQRVADLLARWFSGFFEASRDQSLKQFLSERLLAVGSDINLTSAFGRMLELMLSNQHHHGLLNDLFRYLASALPEHRESLRERFGDDRPWWLPGAVDRKVFNEMMDRGEQRLAELAVDDEHPLRRQLEARLAQFADDLQHDPDTRARLEQWRQALGQGDHLQQYIDVLWDQFAAELVQQLGDADSHLRQALPELLLSTAQRLTEQPDTRRALNAWLTEFLSWALASNAPALTSIISDTVRSWDGKTAARRIELSVGRDLQFIRINGTLVGGLVGLILHAVVIWLQ